MNQALTDFFARHYAPGRVGLVGATDLIGSLIRKGQAGLTPHGKPSRWSHAFLLGERRDDGRSDGSTYIYESDLKVSVTDWQVKNGAMESRLTEQHLRYPVGELFGTLWAVLTRRLSKRNIFDDKHAVQCSTFVRMCYRHIGRDPLNDAVDLTHTNPEALYRSAAFDVREEWHRA
jgi:hypothetical protein